MTNSSSAHLYILYMILLLPKAPPVFPIYLPKTPPVPPVGLRFRFLAGALSIYDITYITPLWIYFRSAGWCYSSNSPSDAVWCPKIGLVWDSPLALLEFLGPNLGSCPGALLTLLRRTGHRCRVWVTVIYLWMWILCDFPLYTILTCVSPYSILFATANWSFVTMIITKTSFLSGVKTLTMISPVRQPIGRVDIEYT